jgi:hypothetical protein
MNPDVSIMDFYEMQRTEILDREAEINQFFDDLCDGQRDTYLDQAE